MEAHFDKSAWKKDVNTLKRYWHDRSVTSDEFAELMNWVFDRHVSFGAHRVASGSSGVERLTPLSYLDFDRELRRNRRRPGNDTTGFLFDTGY